MHTSTIAYQEHQHVSQEIIVAHERESTFSEKRDKNIGQPSVTFVPNNAIQEREGIVLEQLEDCQPKLPNTGMTAATHVIANTALQVFQESGEEAIAPFTNVDAAKHPVNEQRLSIPEKHAIEVNTQETSIKEGPLYDFKKPEQQFARSTYELHHPLEISNIQGNDKESQLMTRQSEQKHASFEVVESHHMATFETISGESTTKIFPEAMIATEKAQEKVDASFSYSTESPQIVEETKVFDSKQIYKQAMQYMPNLEYLAQSETIPLERIGEISDIKLPQENAKVDILENSPVELYEPQILHCEDHLITKEDNSTTAFVTCEGLPTATVSDVLISNITKTIEQPQPKEGELSVEVEENNHQNQISINNAKLETHQSDSTSILATKTKIDTDLSSPTVIQEEMIGVETSHRKDGTERTHSAEQGKCDLNNPYIQCIYKKHIAIINIITQILTYRTRPRKHNTPHTNTRPQKNHTKCQIKH